jgi:hypothetical protein
MAMSTISISLTARFSVDAQEWANEWGIPLEDVADDLDSYVRNHCNGNNCVGSSNELVTFEWRDAR